MPPSNRTIQQNRPLKEQVLDLLQWRLADMSPDAEHPLHIESGFEREVRLIPPFDMLPEPSSPNWEREHNELMYHCAEILNGKMKGGDTGLDKICPETAGTFLLEIVTNRLGLKEGLAAIERLSAETLKRGQDMDMHGGFGDVDASVVDHLNAERHEAGLPNISHDSGGFRNYKADIAEGSDNKMFKERSQHLNLSVWVGNKNVMDAHEGSGPGSHNLANHVALRALVTQPYAFLVTRRGSYHRINHDVAGLRTFSVGDGHVRGGHSLLYRLNLDPHTIRSTLPETARLEFRDASANAEPIDVAIFSALPLVQACVAEMKTDEQGKILLSGKNLPVVERSRPIIKNACALPLQHKAPVPRDEEAAKALFLSSSNPIFREIDAIAEYKIQRMQQQYDQNPSLPNQQLLRDATGLRGIGTRLFQGYCKEYDLTPDKESMVNSGASFRATQRLQQTR